MCPQFLRFIAPPIKINKSNLKFGFFRVAQYSDRPVRYGQRYRRRSQESDSDESPGRSDHNSSSERDDVAIDRIADLLMEIQDNMKKILERLKRLESSLQQNRGSVSIKVTEWIKIWHAP